MSGVFLYVDDVRFMGDIVDDFCSAAHWLM